MREQQRSKVVRGFFMVWLFGLKAGVNGDCSCGSTEACCALAQRGKHPGMGKAPLSWTDAKQTGRQSR